MAFPTTSVLDTFTGVDATSPPNANWTNKVEFFGASDGVQILGNAASRAAAGGNRGEAYWNVGTFGPDTEVFGTVTVIPDTNGDEVALYARLRQIGSGTTDGYQLAVSHNGVAAQAWEIRIVTDTVGTTLGAPFSQTISTNDKIGLEVTGSTLNAWWAPGGVWQATPLFTRTDLTYAAAGNIGVGFAAFAGVAEKLDDFGGGTIIVPGPAPNFPVAARVRYNG